MGQQENLNLSAQNSVDHGLTPILSPNCDKRVCATMGQDPGINRIRVFVAPGCYRIATHEWNGIAYPAATKPGIGTKLNPTNRDWDFTMVGAARFELTTPCTQNRCATRLRHAPTACP